MRRKTATYKSKPTSENNSTKRNLFESPRVIDERSDWKNKVNSPVVEDALDHFTRHIVSEWVTDLWYSHITTDRQGPEELVLIMNGVLAEISIRMRNVNLLDLLTRFLSLYIYLIDFYTLPYLLYLCQGKMLGLAQGYCQSSMQSAGAFSCN